MASGVSYVTGFTSRVTYTFLVRRTSLLTSS